jgi:hypothetical protein
MTLISNEISDGADLVNDAQGGVVAVVIQYRLGLFGEYLHTPIKCALLTSIPMNRLPSRNCCKKDWRAQRWLA